MHHSGALLLEARDGEFLDEQLCCSTSAPAAHSQQPHEAAPPEVQNPLDGSSMAEAGGVDGTEAYGNDFDDSGGGYDGDDGDDSMPQAPDDLEQAGTKGQ